ncbi:MAG TPA: hypothetical protein VL049_14605 [Candidatus Dormibacteraeota bacterium]|nr:hypothetical protein [Candidatus Dormibacteraeota bacterium]
MLAFLHTAGSHVANFARLVHEIAPELDCRHAVDEELLAVATAAGGVDAALAARIADAIEALRAAGARVVVCTCSTIGDAAEAASRAAAPVLRIDRPMAEEAVRREPGGAGLPPRRIAVVAALDTALAATVQLLRAVARETGREVSIRPVLCAAAWPLFASGDLEGYWSATAAAVRAAAPATDVVVLGQVSMAPVVGQLGDLATPVLAAARLGVQAAVDRCRDLSRAAAPPGRGAVRPGDRAPR